MKTDLISRSKLRIALQRQQQLAIDGLVYVRRDAVLEKINMAPSAAPQWAHAEWEERKDMIVCSGDDGCYEGIRWNAYSRISFGGKLPKFCPFCGAMMTGGVKR